MSNSTSSRNIKRSYGSKARDEGQQLEFQRKNPHLYTTPSQSVNSDGSITTFDQVTSRLQDALKKLDEYHTNKFGGKHPVYCMRPIIGVPEHDICSMIEMLNKDMDRVREGFVRDYMHQVERLQASNESTGEHKTERSDRELANKNIERKQ